jgi:UDP-2,3-diacylglucosamine pyrophosphatase LpxH
MYTVKARITVYQGDNFDEALKVVVKFARKGEITQLWRKRTLLVGAFPALHINRIDYYLNSSKLTSDQQHTAFYQLDRYI